MTLPSSLLPLPPSRLPLPSCRCLPMHPYLEKQDQERISEIIKQF